MSEPTFSILSYKASELPKNYEGMVYSKWLRTLRRGNPVFSKMDTSGPFYEQYHEFLEKLLAKPDSVIKLAVLTDDHDVVLGFSASREDVLDYVYVQPEQRNQKLSNALIPEGITTFSHITNMWFPIWQSKYKHWQFNPFA